MKIALVGGTGDIGTGFAMRWAIAGHDVIIGSRKTEKAQESAKGVLDLLGGEGKVQGMDNASAIKAGEVIVLAVPYEHLNSVTLDLKDAYTTQIVVSPVVPMEYSGKFFKFVPPAEGSAAIQAKGLLPDSVKLASAFHTICASALQDKNRVLKGDTLICGDDAEAKEVVKALAKDIKDLRPLDAGPLSASSMVESLTPMLLNIARRNKMKDVGIKIEEERQI